MVDDEDYEELSKYKWYVQKAKAGNIYYASRNLPKKHAPDKHGCILMHRTIMNTPAGMKTDHIDHDGLNNQKNNLRICTHAENLRNTRIRSDNASGLKGVCFDKINKKWRANIWLNGKQKNLGRFLTKNEARQAYKKASIKYYREFASFV